MKRLLCTFLAIVLCLTISAPVFAECSSSDATLYEESFVAEEQSRAEETIWYFRCYDGLFQRRLWSITYGYWLTEWETIGTC